MIEVSIIIPTFNRRADLQRTLVALRDQTEKRFEVIVVDNSSDDGTDAMVERMGTDGSLPYRLRYHRKQPEGPAAARNLGARVSDRPVLAFLDSDVTPAPDWLQLCLSELHRDPELGAVAGPLLYASQPDLINSYGGCLSPIGLAWDGLEGEALDQVTGPREVLWINSAAMVLRREPMQAVGGFDERFFYAYEESDLGWRLNIAGWRLRMIPEAKVFHHIGDEIGLSDPRIVFHSCKNRVSSMLSNAGPAWLLRWLPVYVAYALVDSAARPPRLAKAKALFWALSHLGGTLQRRRLVAKQRKRSDRDLRPLLEPRLFPAVPLAGRRRRPHQRQSATGGLSRADDRF